MYTVKESIENAVLDIISWDGDVTYESIEEILKYQIGNLKNQIGEEFHKKELEYGIVDLTGMTWEQQDDQARELINDYKKAIDEIRKKKLNLKKIEDEMIQWARTH